MLYFGAIIKLILLIIVVLLLVSCVRIVPQAHTYITEFLGKYYSTWEAGLHFKIPILQRVSRKISLKEQVLDFPPQPVITKDNVSMDIDAVIFAKVFDPKLYTYGVEDPIRGLQNLSATTLRNIIGELELDQTLTSRDQINAQMKTILDDATDPWGLTVTRVELKNIQPPSEIEEVMTKQMRAERERRQTVLEAQAHKEAVVARATGDKEAKVLAAQAEREAKIALAQGEAESIRLVYEAQAQGLEMLKDANINESVLRLKGLDALRDVADGRATKIYRPSDIASAVAALGVASESLGIGDATPVDKAPKAPSVPDPDPLLKPSNSMESAAASACAQRVKKEVETEKVNH